MDSTVAAPATLQVKVLARSPFSNQLFWFREAFYKSSRQLQNFRRHGDQNGGNLEGCPVVSICLGINSQ